MDCRTPGAATPAYRLRRRADGLAVTILERARARAERPQAKRDLGLALADAGCARRGRALYGSRPEDGRSIPDIDLIALTEMNAVATSATARGPSNVRQSIPGYRKPPLDVRVVRDWAADNTDVDLPVIDPKARNLLRPILLPGRCDHARRDRRYGPEGSRLMPSCNTRRGQLYGHRSGRRGDGLMLWLSGLRQRPRSGPAHDPARQDEAASASSRRVWEE